MVAGLIAIPAFAAFEAGGLAFTKRQETALLAEPKPLAGTAATLPYGRELRIEEVRGAWLRVSAGAHAGWVFRGNLAATKPAEIKGLLDGVPQFASQTTATAAARPLSTVVAGYAAGMNLASAQGDLEWVIAECTRLTDAEVEAYLRAQQKGEYQ
jgi:hypothetical protein